MEKKYGSLIQGLELLDIYLGTAQFKRHGFPDPDSFPEVKITFGAGKSSFRQNGEEFTVDQEFRFLLEETSTDRAKSRKLFELKGMYTLVYHTTCEVDEELFDLFKRRNVPVNLHPFARELIHNMMNKAGLPSFILPALKIKR